MVIVWDTLGERRVHVPFQALVRAKTGPNLLGCYCSGPSVTSDGEQHWRRPGLLWQTANMGPKAAMDERRVR